MKIKKLRRLTAAAIFAAVSVILSQISFTIPATVIPFSFGIFAAFLCGALLPKYYALLSQIIYLALGAVGLPVFSQLRGGLSVLAGPTGGYLIGYLFIAFFVSSSAGHFKNHLKPALFSSMTAALIVTYIFGTAWYAFQTDSTFAAAFALCVVPFIVPDLIKITLAVFFSLALRKALEKSGLSVL